MTGSIEDRVLDVLATCEALTPGEVAQALVDEDVAAGEYDGCSTELELAAGEYERAAARVKHELGHPLEQMWS